MSICDVTSNVSDAKSSHSPTASRMSQIDPEPPVTFRGCASAHGTAASGTVRAGRASRVPPLGVELVRAERLRTTRERPDSPDAVDLVMRGRVADLRFGPASQNEAIDYFERALKLDPDLMMAKASRSRSCIFPASRAFSRSMAMQATARSPKRAT